MIKEHNPVDLKTFLFGGPYNRYGDPCNRTNMEGWHTFDYDHHPENFKDIKTFKDAIETILGEYGYNDKDGMCQFISDNDEDNPSFHTYEMPDEQLIEEWYYTQISEAADPSDGFSVEYELKGKTHLTYFPNKEIALKFYGKFEHARLCEEDYESSNEILRKGNFDDD
jgi:hypothetical protein